MTEDGEYLVYVGIDWGSESHAVCVVDRHGHRTERTVPHTSAGLATLAAELVALSPADPGQVAVAIELPRGAIVETLLAQGLHVYALNPKQLDRFRDRHSVAGAKDDQRDAFVLQDALRTDRRAFRRLQMDDPLIVELRELSRLDDDLREELSRLSNRLRAQLHRICPDLLALCPAADEPWFWALLERAFTPRGLRTVSGKAVSAVLKTYRIRRVTVETVHAAVQAPPLRVAPGTVEAVGAHIALLLPRLQLVHDQRTRTVRARMEAVLAELAQDDQPGQHRDVTLLRSLPGVGSVVAATVLAEASRLLADRDYQTLRAQAGVAPVTRQSGKTKRVSMRAACNPRLRYVLYHWARISVQVDPHCRAHYDRLRQHGHDRARALRGVADRALRILIAMLTSRTLYDPAHCRQTAA